MFVPPIYVLTPPSVPSTSESFPPCDYDIHHHSSLPYELQQLLVLHEHLLLHLLLHHLLHQLLLLLLLLLLFESDDVGREIFLLFVFNDGVVGLWQGQQLGGGGLPLVASGHWLRV